MPISKVGRRGQTTIPKEIRDQFNLKEGDSLFFYVRDGVLIVRPLQETLLDYVGFLKDPTVRDWAEEAREGMARDAMRTDSSP